MFTEDQVQLLEEKLQSSAVSQRSQSGTKLSYLEGYHVIDEANRIFGFDGWETSIDEIKVVGTQDVTVGAKKMPGVEVAVIAHVTVTVIGDKGEPAFAGSISRSDVGFGSQRGTSKVAVYEMAYKEAVTDALKRAFRTFGNQFGNALYDKTQKNVTSTAPTKAKSVPKPAPKAETKTAPAVEEAPEEEPKFKEMIDALKTEVEFIRFRAKYKDQIKASPNKDKIVTYFKTKKENV